jgi:signal transduction histidine kinase
MSSTVPTDEVQLIASLTDVLRRKRDALLSDDPLREAAFVEPIWPPLLEALATHAARRRADPQAPASAELRAQVAALQHEFDTVLNGVNVWSEVLRRSLDASRMPLQGVYGSGAAAPQSLGRV